MLGHGGITLWPLDGIDEVPGLRGFFHGGTVTIFFVIGAFIVTRNLLAERDGGVLDPVRFYLRRCVRLGVQLVPLAAVLLLGSAVDSSDLSTAEQNRESVLGMLTFTLNPRIAYDPLATRPDVGHLWYLSVQQQAYLVLPLAVALFAAYRRWFAGGVLLLVVATVAWRFHVFASDGWWVAGALTLTRVDGVLAGVLLAIVFPSLGRLAPRAALLLGMSLLVMLLLVLTSGEVGEFAFLRSWGVAVTLVSTAIVCSIALAPATSPVMRALSWRPLVVMGRASLAIYVWHYPIFWAVQRHTQEWSWYGRTLLAVVVLALVVVVVERLIEDPTRRFLRTSPLLASRRSAFPGGRVAVPAVSS